MTRCTPSITSLPQPYRGDHSVLGGLASVAGSAQPYSRGNLEGLGGQTCTAAPLGTR